MTDVFNQDDHDKIGEQCPLQKKYGCLGFATHYMCSNTYIFYKYTISLGPGSESFAFFSNDKKALFGLFGF